ncbi:hypothetical protein DSECCO2_637710 [anaerobic digester metagenome]
MGPSNEFIALPPMNLFRRHAERLVAGAVVAQDRVIRQLDADDVPKVLKEPLKQGICLLYAASRLFLTSDILPDDDGTGDITIRDNG